MQGCGSKVVKVSVYNFKDMSLSLALEVCQKQPLDWVLGTDSDTCRGLQKWVYLNHPSLLGHIDLGGFFTSSVTYLHIPLSVVCIKAVPAWGNRGALEKNKDRVPEGR